MSTMEDGRHMTERILQLTLEVIYLLTGEDYSVVKTASLESLFCGVYPSIPGRWSRSQSPTAQPPPPSPDRSNKRRMVEVRSRLMELLAAPDDDLLPSVEKWGYGEGSRDVYKAAMMEAEPQPPGNGHRLDPAEPPAAPVKHELLSLAEEKPLPSSGVSPPAHQHPDPPIKEELRPCEEESRQRFRPAPYVQFPSSLREEVEEEEEEEEEPPLLPDQPLPCPDTSDKENLLPLADSCRACGEETPLLCSHTALCYKEAPPPPSHPALCYKEAPPPHLFTSVPSEETYHGRADTSHHYEEELPNSDASLHRHAGNHLRRHDASLCREEEHPPHLGPSPIQAEKHLPHFATLLCAETSPSPPTHRLPYRFPRIKEEHRLCQQEPSPPPAVPTSAHYGQYGTAPGSGGMAFACAKCEGRFLSHHELIAHMNTHAGAKPHSCPICRNGFHSLSELEKHRAAYTGRKPYCCCICRRAFPNKASLSIHHKRHLQGIPSALGDGGKHGSGKGGFLEHQGGETGRKPYSCFECGKCFTSYSNLSNHQKIHSGLKPYICSECGKCFVRRFNLVRHMTVHRKKTANHA